MMKNYPLLRWLAVFVFMNVLYTEGVSQALTVKGRITASADNQPLPSANVVVKGTTTGATADADGYYSLQVPSGNAILVFSFVSFENQEIAVNNRSEINIALSEVSALQEVVVVGYGTVKKSDLTGSVVSLKTKDMTPGANVNLQQALLGRAAGVQVYQKSGEPGSAVSVKIRGISSITAGNDPLYVIDGIPVNDGAPVGGNGAGFVNNPNPRSTLNSLNPNDIESIEILKDASATAIYGARGANGVVMITTKRGQEGKMRMTYNGNYGIQEVAKTPQVLTGEQYRDVLNAIIDAGGGVRTERVADNVVNTDWQKTLQQQGSNQSHDIAFSGGNNATKYYFSLGYFNQKGVLLNSGLDRYSARLNLENRLANKYAVGININTSYIKDVYNAVGLGVNENGSAQYAALYYDPTVPVYAADGSYNRSTFIGTTMDNPLAIIHGQQANSDSYRTFGNVFGEYNLTPALSIRAKLGGDINSSQRNTWIDPSTLQGVQSGGIATLTTGNRSYYMAEGTLNYVKNFADKHNINAVAGATYENFGSNSFSATGRGYTLTDLKYNAIGTGTQTLNSIGSGRNESRLVSYLARVNYSFNNRYLLTASIRADGSSRFGENNRFGYFPSAAVAWKMHEEGFLKNIKPINELKLRVSYGSIGNQSIGNFLYLTTFSAGGDAIFNGNRVTSISPTRNPNPDLKWEAANQMDIGVDFVLFNSRLRGTVEYYDRRTTDLLLGVPLPLSSGFGSQTRNIGSMKNTGIEVTLGADIVKTPHFKWTIDGNASTLKNEVVSLGGAASIFTGDAGFINNAGIITPGQSMGSYYGYRVLGVWQTGDDFSTTSAGVKAGDVKYDDINGDKAITDLDRVILGKSIPDFFFGLTNTVSFKGLSLSVFVEGSQGASVLSNDLIDSYFPVSFRRNKLAIPYLNRWTATNPTNDYPSFINPTVQGQRIVNSRTVQDASYVRIQSVRLGYDLPLKNKRNISLFVVGQNLYTFTDYIGVDPAVNAIGNDILRIDYSSFPMTRTFMGGVTVQF
jgi:TonB-dependent starch-binding outer membrane protein SusC